MEFVVIWIGKTKSGFATYLDEESAQRAAEGLRNSDLFVAVRKINSVGEMVPATKQ
jgi:hypothetical protein